MLIKSVTLNNCGAYAGRHRFDLTTEDGRPIILIGGYNGGGKTTLFDSVLLCLYGMRYAKTTKKVYERRLMQMIHRRRKDGLVVSEEWSSVSIEIVLHRSGRDEEYTVERRWRISKEGVVEEIHVEALGRDGLDVMGRDQAQSFVNGLIPRGVADLFFFDGEMISQMAEKGESTAMKLSFDSLLGLDMVEQLQADLRTNLARSLTGGDKHLREELARLTAQREDVESSVTRLRESLVRKESDLKGVRAMIEDAEAQLDLLGGSYARRYSDTKNELAAKRIELEATGKRMTELCSGELPFGLVREEMEKVGEQINADRVASQQAVKHDTIASTVRTIKSSIEALDGVPSDIVAKIMPVLDGALPDTTLLLHREVLGFSISQQEGIFRTIENASGVTLEAARREAQEYARIREGVTGLESAIGNAPNDDEIGPIISEINKMHNETGRLEAEVDHLENEISSGEAMIRHLASKIRVVLNGQYKNKKAQRMAKLTESVQRTLDIYSEKLRITKMSLLESNIMDVSRILMHKEIIKEVSIDPETFEMRLRDGSGNAIPRQSLAKGEQQMLATSVLWALARTSGRPLPFMIDTPMARLDQSHRNNLVEQFFPQASHQMLILSTDTEIGPTEYVTLHPYVSKAYTLTYDPESESTKIRNDYFWDSGGNEVQ